MSLLPQIWLGQCWGAKGQNYTDHAFINQHCYMAEDILKQLLHHVRACEFYALKLDESTGVAGLAHVLVYVQYIHEGTVKEYMFFCKNAGHLCDIKQTYVDTVSASLLMVQSP